MKGKRRGSVLIAVLCIFILVSAFALIVYSYSMSNLNQAKIQEENMHAYYLAYSGCELTYALLIEEAKDKTGVPKPEDKWEEFVKSFGPERSVCITQSGTEIEPGYVLKASLPNMGENRKLLLRISKLSNSPPHSEINFANHIKIEAIGRTNIGGKYQGERTKYLYIDPKTSNQVFWR